MLCVLFIKWFVVRSDCAGICHCQDSLESQVQFYQDIMLHVFVYICLCVGAALPDFWDIEDFASLQCKHAFCSLIPVIPCRALT